MNAALQINDEQFFAPASTDMVDGLVGRYRAERQRMERGVCYSGKFSTAVIREYFYCNLCDGIFVEVPE